MADFLVNQVPRALVFSGTIPGDEVMMTETTEIRFIVRKTINDVFSIDV
jgi:hypothetical protein